MEEMEDDLQCRIPEVGSETPVEQRSKTDIGWNYASRRTDNGVEAIYCNFCDKRFRGGGINRVKQHLAHVGKDASKCRKVSKDVREKLAVLLTPSLRRKTKQSQSDIDDGVDSTIRGKVGEESSTKQVTLKKYFVEPDAVEKTKIEIAKFFYDTGIPFHCCKSRYFISMLVAVSKLGDALKIPTYHELRVPLLKHVKQSLQLWIDSMRGQWSRTGCSVMADGWTDTSGRSLVNFLIYSPLGTVFFKSVNLSDKIRDANTLFHLFVEVIDWVGPKSVIQVITDNASNYRKCGMLLETHYGTLSWSPCAAHCVNLMFKDIGNLTTIKLLVDKAAFISRFVYNHGHWLAWLRKRESWREIVRPADTRFATNFVALHSMVDRKDDLQALSFHREFSISPLGRDPKGKKFQNTVRDAGFWNDCEVIITILRPLMKFLRIVDGDKRPTMGFVYEGMRKVTETIKTVCRNQPNLYRPFLIVIENRWEKTFKKNIHAAAYFLNPQFQYDPKYANELDKVNDHIVEVFERYGRDNTNELVIELNEFRNKRGHFARHSAEQAAKNEKIHPADWWTTFGQSTPTLRQLAVKILGQTSSSSGCERN